MSECKGSIAAFLFYIDIYTVWLLQRYKDVRNLLWKFFKVIFVRKKIVVNDDTGYPAIAQNSLLPPN